MASLLGTLIVMVIGIGLIFIGYFVAAKKNSKEPEFERKWTDPKNVGR